MDADLNWIKGLSIGTVVAVAIAWTVRQVVPWYLKRLETQAATEKSFHDSLLQVVRDNTAAMTAMQVSSEAHSRALEAIGVKVDNVLNGLHREQSSPGGPLPAGVRVISGQGQ